MKKLFEKKKEEEIEETSTVNPDENTESVDEEPEKKPAIPKAVKVVGGTALGLLAVFGITKLFNRGSAAPDWDFSDEEGSDEEAKEETETTPADSDDSQTTTAE